MNIIGLNRIANYIQKNPHSKTELVIWLKNELYRPQPAPSIIYGAGNGGLENKHFYRMQSNYAANVHWITWMGSADENAAMLKTEREKHEGLVTVKKVISVTLGSRTKQPALLPPAPPQPVDAGLAFETEAGYDEAFTKLTSLIKAETGNAEFDELKHLVARIKSYEMYRLPFPTVTLHNMVKARMDQIVAQLPDMHGVFARRIGSKYDAFIAGEAQLPPSKLKPLMKSLGLNFQLSDRRFME